jgi:hypothetical protein
MGYLTNPCKPRNNTRSPTQQNCRHSATSHFFNRLFLGFAPFGNRERVGVALPTYAHTMLLSARSFRLWVSLVLLKCLVGSALDAHWYPATATWYGSPEGDGSDGNGFPFTLLFAFICIFSSFGTATR